MYNKKKNQVSVNSTVHMLMQAFCNTGNGFHMEITATGQKLWWRFRGSKLETTFELNIIFMKAITTVTLIYKSLWMCY